MQAKQNRYEYIENGSNLALNKFTTGKGVNTYNKRVYINFL